MSQQSVGYKKPPQECHFKSGVSGNPRGRPRKHNVKIQGDLDTSKLYRRVAAGPVGIDDPMSKRRSMPAVEAIVLRQTIMAVNGDGISARRVMTQLDRDQSKQQAEHRHNIKILAEYKAAWTAEFRRCTEDGDPIREIVPHPDDIAINSSSGEIWLNGPYDDVTAAEWAAAAATRQAATDRIRDLRASSSGSSRKQRTAWRDQFAAESDKIAELDRLYPAVEVRRKPGFRLEHYRAFGRSAD